MKEKKTSMEFHVLNPDRIPWSSMEFHGVILHGQLVGKIQLSGSNDSLSCWVPMVYTLILGFSMVLHSQ